MWWDLGVCSGHRQDREACEGWEQSRRLARLQELPTDPAPRAPGSGERPTAAPRVSLSPGWLTAERSTHLGSGRLEVRFFLAFLPRPSMNPER